MHLGEVPEEVFQQELLKYLQRRAKDPEAKRVKAQFEYNGKKYTFQRSNSSSGFQIKHSDERVAKEQRRSENLNQVPLGEIEKLMIANYYGEAARRGLHVDHRYPAARGGYHHPSNLGLMIPKENLRKGDQVGGNYKYEPFLEFSTREDLSMRRTAEQGKPPELSNTTASSPEQPETGTRGFDKSVKPSFETSAPQSRDDLFIGLMSLGNEALRIAQNGKDEVNYKGITPMDALSIMQKGYGITRAVLSGIGAVSGLQTR